MSLRYLVMVSIVKLREHGPCHRTRTGRFEGEATCQSDNLFELWALDTVV